MEDIIEDILLLLADYKMDYTVPSYSPRNRKQFEECSNHKWAVDELEIYIISHIGVDPVDACVMFIRQMSYYRRRYGKNRAELSAAIEVAEDVLDILLSEGGLHYE